VNAKDPRAGDGYTQFGRAIFDLNIDVICAHSPAAKGRVERAHQVLQDRLVKAALWGDIPRDRSAAVQMAEWPVGDGEDHEAAH